MIKSRYQIWKDLRESDSLSWDFLVKSGTISGRDLRWMEMYEVYLEAERMYGHYGLRAKALDMLTPPPFDFQY